MIRPFLALLLLCSAALASVKSSLVFVFADASGAAR